MFILIIPHHPPCRYFSICTKIWHERNNWRVGYAGGMYRGEFSAEYFTCGRSTQNYSPR